MDIHHIISLISDRIYVAQNNGKTEVAVALAELSERILCEARL